MKISRELANAYRKLERQCDVRNAKVACIATIFDFPTLITTNRRGQGKISKWTQHAEERCITQLMRLGWNRINATLTVVRWRNDGTIGCAKPCHGCDSLLRKAGVRHVYYSTSHGTFAQLF